MKRFRVLGLALCAMMVTGTATADDFVRFGPYLGLNAAWGYPLFEDEVQNVLGSDTELNDTFGLNTRAGLRLLSFLAVEAQYEWLNDFKIDTAPSNAIPDVSIIGHTLTGNVKLYIPIRRIQPYFLAGFGFTSYKFEASGVGSRTDTYFAGRLGGGLDVYLTKKWAINAEATALLTASDLGDLPNNVSGSLNGLHYISASLGLMYRF